jgi:hypothetical protein
MEGSHTQVKELRKFFHWRMTQGSIAEIWNLQKLNKYYGQDCCEMGHPSSQGDGKGWT